MDIIRRLTGSEDWRDVVHELECTAPIAMLVGAARRTEDPEVLAMLFYVLGRRRAKSAVPLLIGALDSPDPHLRGTAADMLSRSGSPRAGSALFEHFVDETDIGIRLMLALGLGTTGYQPAVPALIAALESDSGMLRACAAWSLGVVRATAARPALQEALVTETYETASEKIEGALAELDRPSS